MFTQFFGCYLLNNGYITDEQFAEAAEAVKVARVKLGVLAINAGYMTAKQVETVLEHQRTEDKRIGEIAVDMGFMTGEQVEELFSAQQPVHLVLGQVLVNKGFLSTSQFQEALNSYKERYSLNDEDLSDSGSEKIRAAISNFYEFDNSDDDIMVSFVELFFRNLTRFIGGDFMPLNSCQLTEYKFTNAALQRVKGRFSCGCAVDASDSAYAGFALRFSDRMFSDSNISADNAVGDFVDLHNGIFTVNVSNIAGFELKKGNVEFVHNEKYTDMEDTFKISVVYPFGNVNFIAGTF